MKRLFVLGSGFSKAVCNSMPLTRELSEIVLEKTAFEPELSSPRLRNFVQSDNFEATLSYLVQQAPWKDKEHAAGDMALFHKIAKQIFKRIMERESLSLDIDNIPDWLKTFIRYLHGTNSTAITFNYDTILERATRYIVKPSEKINFEWLYPKIMMNAKRLDHAPRWGTDVQQKAPFPFVKLHGSINWYYSGNDHVHSEQFVFTSFEKKNPEFDLNEVKDYLIDREPLLIPPVAEKSPFYTIALVKVLWKLAHQAISEADEIYFCGYSLPETDLTTHFLLMSAVKPTTKIFVVNTTSEPEKIEKRYRNAMNQVDPTNFDLTWVRDNAIPEFVTYMDNLD